MASADLPVVCLLDTGVNSAVFGNCLVKADFRHPVSDVNDNYGHGTPVGSLIVWCEDLLEKNSHLEPKSRIISYKIIEPGKHDGVNLPNALNDAIRMYNTETKVYNMSLNLDESVDPATRIRYCDEIDKIVQKHNILLVNSTGNIENNQIEWSIGTGAGYPEYLERFPLKQPADGKNVVSVGSFTNAKNSHSIAPSDSFLPFSRVAVIPDITDQRIKPEIHAIGGNSTYKDGIVGVEDSLSVPIINHDNSVGYSAGTSLSAPQISSILARLTKIYAGTIINAETYRALLYSSSQVFKKFDRFYFGLPQVDRLFNPTRNSFFIFSEGGLGLPERRYDKVTGMEEAVPQESFNFVVPSGTKRISIFVVHSDNYSDGLYTYQNTKLKVSINKPGARMKVGPHYGNLDKWCTTRFGIFEYAKNYMGMWKVTVEPEHRDMLPRLIRGVKIRYGLVVRIDRDPSVPGYLGETLEEIYGENVEHNLESILKPEEPVEEVAIALA